MAGGGVHTETVCMDVAGQVREGFGGDRFVVGSRCVRGVAVGRRSKPVEKKEGGGQGPHGIANRACSVRSPHISKRAQGGGTGGGKGGYRLWKTALLLVAEGRARCGRKTRQKEAA